MAVETAPIRSQSLEIGKIHQGDCIDLMRQIEAGTIDLAFADPPFNIGYSYDEYHDRQDSDEYVAWSRAWIAEVHRVLKPNGSFWLAIGDEFAAERIQDRVHAATVRRPQHFIRKLQRSGTPDVLHSE